MNIDMQDDLNHRFGYHKPVNDGIAADHQFIRNTLRDAACEVVAICPPSRELSLAITKLEEAMFWANAAIARIKNYQD